MSLRKWVRLGIAVGLAGSAAVAGAQDDRPTTPFDREILIARAEQLAKEPYTPPPQPAAAEQQRLTYEQYSAIRFETGAAIWQHEGRNFTIELFHPGFIYDMPVNINLVVGKTARRVLYTDEVFEYGPEVPEIDGKAAKGYSGFGVRSHVHGGDALDEFLVFQGASYFRGIGKDQVYGISARGLAVRTARPEGEEFPVFTDFFIERPPEGAEQLVIHALLQSQSVVGAYKFTARPGESTTVDVEATLFARTELGAYGIGPLTSMFLFDATNRARFDDYRSAVHDSDGLQMLSGRGERIWRPLANPRMLQVSAFVDENPRGFGLLQRKRSFDDFEDAEAEYERRPSLWVEPNGDWGRGHVELVEIPSDRDIHDNIVAYWQPDAPLKPGERRDFAYRLRFGGAPLDAAVARVVATRAGRALEAEQQRAFVLDFQGESPPPDGLTINASTSAGRIVDARGELVEERGVYRVRFQLDPERADLAELRVVLVHDGQPWSETWLYRWSR